MSLWGVLKSISTLFIPTVWAREKCVGMLLKSGSNPNLPMRDGRRSLHIAAYSGNARNVRLLLENGGDVALADGNGETALHLAVKGCHLKTLKVRKKSFLKPLKKSQL